MDGNGNYYLVVDEFFELVDFIFCYSCFEINI